MTADDAEGGSGRYTPLFEAQNASRYDRQGLIRAYQEANDCTLVVVSSPIYGGSSLNFFEELIHDCQPDHDLHVMLQSAGGDGETAIRMVRSAQSRCRTLTVVLPDQAKSAATLFALGAHRLLMGPFGDLGPIDPQILVGDGWVAAKDIRAAVEDASARIQAAPASYPLWASLFSNLTAIQVQQAQSALLRTSDQLREALESQPERLAEDVATLVANLEEKLITKPNSHAAIFGAREAAAAGLPVEPIDPTGDYWRHIWRLASRYAVLGNVAVYEGERASQVFPLTPT